MITGNMDFIKKGKEKLKEMKAKAEEQALYDTKAAEVETMVQEAELINNTRNVSKYPQIDRMYDGLHWEEKIDGVAGDRLVGYSKLKHNFIADIVDRWTMFIGANPPSFSVQTDAETSIKYDITPQDESLEEDQDEAEAIKKIIWKCLRQQENSWRSTFLRIAHIQSRYGRVLPYVRLTSGLHYPVMELLKPQYSYPVFDSKDYSKLLYFVYKKYVDRKKLSKELDVEDLAAESDPYSPIDIGERETTALYTVITDKEFITYAGKRIWKITPNPLKNIPIFNGQNRITPFSADGKDDISGLFSDQKAYNMTYSNLIDAAEDHAIGKRLIKKPGASTDMSKLYDRHQRHVIIGPETEIEDLHPAISLPELKEALSVVRQSIEDDSGITELLKGRFSGSIATGVALSGLSRGIEDIARQKINNLSEMLEKVFNQMLFQLKNYQGSDPETGIAYSEIIKKDWYNIDFYWDNTTIQDERVKATTNIDLVNAGVKSRITAMKDMKIKYPEDEQTRVSYEKTNPLLNPELAIQIAQASMQEQGFSPEAETAKAKRENSKLLAGMAVEVSETNPGQHAVHIQVHVEMKEKARGRGKGKFDDHIAEHKAKFNTKPQQPAAGGGQPTQNQQPRDIEGPSPAAQEGVGNPTE